MRRIAPSLAAAAALVFALPASATVLYSTNFDPSTFSVGALNGQGGWAVASTGYTTSADQVVVENTVTYDGGQAVEMAATAADGEAPYYALGALTPTDPIVVSMAIENDNTGPLPAIFAVATSPGFDDVTAGVRVVSDGALYALSSGFPEIGTFTPGTWIDVSMTLNYATQTYSVSVDGTLLASNLQFCGDEPDSSTCDGNHISQFGDVEFDPNSPKYGENYIADVSISEVPEPGAWALLIAGSALAGASLRARRRAVA